MNDTSPSSGNGRKAAIRFALVVQWSDDDQCYVGTAPDLIHGGCHGDDPRQVFDQLCKIVDEVIADIVKDGKPLPESRDAMDLWRCKLAPVGTR
jgi:predicted RNase H-like HicB family nuclease